MVHLSIQNCEITHIQPKQADYCPSRGWAQKEAGARIEAGGQCSESLIDAGSRIEAEFILKPGLKSTHWHSAASEVHALGTNRIQRDLW